MKKEMVPFQHQAKNMFLKIRRNFQSFLYYPRSVPIIRILCALVPNTGKICGLMAYL